MSLCACGCIDARLRAAAHGHARARKEGRKGTYLLGMVACSENGVGNEGAKDVGFGLHLHATKPGLGSRLPHLKSARQDAAPTSTGKCVPQPSPEPEKSKPQLTKKGEAAGKSLYTVAQEHLRKGNFQAARRMYEMLANSPDPSISLDGRAYVAWGKMEAKLREPWAMRKVFSQGMKFMPDNVSNSVEFVGMRAPVNACALTVACACANLRMQKCPSIGAKISRLTCLCLIRRTSPMPGLKVCLCTHVHARTSMRFRTHACMHARTQTNTSTMTYTPSASDQRDMRIYEPVCFES